MQLRAVSEQGACLATSTAAPNKRAVGYTNPLHLCMAPKDPDIAVQQIMRYAAVDVVLPRGTPMRRCCTRRRESIVSEFDLICGDAWKAQATNSGFFLGFLIGAALFGFLADRCGAAGSVSVINCPASGWDLADSSVRAGMNVSCPGTAAGSLRRQLRCVDVEPVAEGHRRMPRRAGGTQMCADCMTSRYVREVIAGRRPSLFGAVCSAALLGAASASAPDYWWYLATRSLTGA